MTAVQLLTLLAIFVAYGLLYLLIVALKLLYIGVARLFGVRVARLAPGERPFNLAEICSN